MFNVALSTINYHLTQIDESGEVQLSTAIRKIRIPSDNCDEQGVLLFMAVIPLGLTSAIPALLIPLELTSSIPVGWRQPSYKSLKGALNN